MSALAPVLKPAWWRLSLGAADFPWLNRLGMALLVLSVAVLLSWCAALWLGAWRHRSFGWSEPLALCLCAWGLRHAWRLWCGCRAPLADVTLRWTGPVHAAPAGAAAGGWRVDEWGDQPVNVSMVWDLQRFMLLCLHSAGANPHKDWVWLQDRPDGSGVSGCGVHRLRTLLLLPRSMTETTDVGRSRHVGVMASSMRVSPTRSASRTNQRGSPASNPLCVEDDFPATEILDGWPGEPVDVTDATRGRA